MNNKEASLIIVGFGKQGRKYLDAAKNLDMNVSGIVDPKLAGQDFEGTFANKIRFSLEELEINKKNKVIAVISTPPGNRAQDLMVLVDKGVRSFIVEKPLAVTETELNIIDQLVEDYQLDLVVNYTYRLADAFLYLKLSGEAQNVRAGRFFLGAPGGAAEWKHQAGIGGAAFELGVHMIDLCCYLSDGFVSSDVLVKRNILKSRLCDVDGVKKEVDNTADDVYLAELKTKNYTGIVEANFLTEKFTNSVVLYKDEGIKTYSISVGANNLNEYLDENYVSMNTYERIISAMVDLNSPIRNVLHECKDSILIQKIMV